MMWIFLGLAAVAVSAAIVVSCRHRSVLTELEKLLDDAIAGDFRPEVFDETQVSKLSAKLYRYLSSARLRRSHLEEEYALVRELISDISHQTKTPVANILLYAQLLAEQPELSEQSRALAGQIGSGAEKLSFLISALVKSSRLETGVIQIRPEARNLYPLAAAAAADCLPKAREKGVALTLPADDSPAAAFYDPKWCAEAVYNIIDNAVKYTPPGGSVDVSLHDHEMFACITVTDTGKGISEADLPRVFSRFYRSLDSSQEEGVGIGLYLAREIVQKCGGYIQARSCPGEGSAFSVYLSKLKDS